MKKFSMTDLLNNKSKEEIKKPTDNHESNEISTEKIMPPDKNKYNTHAVNRTVTLIAAEINDIKEKTRKMVLYNSIEIGRRLVEAKQMLEHGEWGKWLKESVDYSQRTANNLMRIFQEYGSEQITLLEDNSKSQAFANLSYSQAVALLELSQNEREEFIDKNDVENMSTRELQKLVKEKQQLEKKLKAVEEREVAEKIKNKEILVNREVEIENLRNHAKELKKKLVEAQSDGDSEKIKNLQLSLKQNKNNLEDALENIKELEKELKEKPIEVTATIEKIPEEVEEELQELRKKASKNDESTIKFSIYFKNFNNAFELLINTLNEIPKDEVKEECKKTLIDTINSIYKKL